MTMPAVPSNSAEYAEYAEYLKKNINFIERFIDRASGLDERMDYTNYLLTQILKQMGVIPTPYQPGTPPGEPVVIIKNKPTFLTGQKTIPVAGTAVQLTTTNLQVPNNLPVIVIAKPTNTGYLSVASSKGDAEGGNAFYGLGAGLAVALWVTNVNIIWVTSDVAGDGVSWKLEV